MISSEQIEQAIKVGQNQAKKVLEFRNGALEKREKVMYNTSTSEKNLRLMLDPKKKDALGTSEARDILIAEGDSWFDYPFHDIVRILEDDYGYEVESVAHKGDRVEDMAYSGGQLEKLTRLIEKVLRRNIVPRAILFSGGGNDLAGEAFGMLLNHKGSRIGGLNDSIVEGVIGERLKMAYITMISKVTAVCEERIGKALPILVHGYDYPVADGRGYMGGWWFLPGPWLEPGFREKGFRDDNLQERIDIVKELINRFNEMLKELVALPQFSHVHYVNLRKTLSSSIDDYKEDWGNEMHPNEDGFSKVTEKFNVVIEDLT